MQLGGGWLILISVRDEETGSATPAKSLSWYDTETGFKLISLVSLYLLLRYEVEGGVADTIPPPPNCILWDSVLQ